MIGRQVITVNKTFTLQELEQFMQANWDKEQYGNFRIGKPTSMSAAEYILLPATRRFLVIVYPKAAGGLFSKDNKVVLTEYSGNTVPVRPLLDTTYSGMGTT